MPLLRHCTTALFVLSLVLAVPCFGQTANSEEEAFLDVTIAVFTPKPAETAPGANTEAPVEQTAETLTGIDVDSAEARYLPVLLRHKLVASQNWGAVRIMPQLDTGAELMLEGTIIRSDGAVLELQIVATDSTGRIWLDKTYLGQAIDSVALNQSELTQDAFQYLFDGIVRDLGTARQQLDNTALAEIRNVAFLRYAQALSPQSFSGFLQEPEPGLFHYERLPASDDPLLTRIRNIREREYLFIDVVDQEYQTFYEAIKPVYDMWRKFRREQAESASDFEERETSTSSDFRRGSYRALQESYNNYRWAKLQEQYLDELTEGFANEIEPTDIELADSLYRLSGTFAQQQREWRTILLELFELEGF